MPYNAQKWNLVFLLDQLDANYFGLRNEFRHYEAVITHEARNLIEQSINVPASIVCTFLDLIAKRDDSVKNQDAYGYGYADECLSLLRSIYPFLPD